MAKKDVIVKVTVSNNGLCFEDDVDYVVLTVPSELKVYRVQNIIEKVNEELKEEDDDGMCGYDHEGWNVTTLMDNVCERASDGWSWRFIRLEISVEI